MLKNWNNGRRLLIITALILLVTFLLTTTVVQAWPWKTVWLKFNVKNKTGQTVNRIIGGGISAFKSTECLSGSSPMFPNCWVGSLYIDFEDIPPFWITGFWFGTADTPPGMVRKIGFGRKFCQDLVGCGAWLDGLTPKGLFPLFGIKCSSPISFVVDESLPVALHPFRLTDVEYAVQSDVIPFEELDHDNPLAWSSTDLLDVIAYAGDSIPVTGIPDEVLLGAANDVMFLRGHLITDMEIGGEFYVDTLEFAAEIFGEKPIPTHTPWGLILLILAVAGFFGYIIMRRKRAMGRTR
jgi:hypothetical protein